MTRAIGAFVATLLVAVPSTASAAFQVWTDSIPVASTNWSGAMSVPLFDPSLGTLTSVVVTLDGSVEGSAAYESLDASPSTVFLDLQATIKLTKPDTTTLVQVIPVASVSAGATAFDSVIDFGGTSGGSFTGLSGTASDTSTFTSPVDLALFTGIGTISLPASATGASNGSGPGNLITSFSNSAGAGLTVRYNYTLTSIPEPGTFAVGGLLIFAIAALNKKTNIVRAVFG